MARAGDMEDGEGGGRGPGRGSELCVGQLLWGAGPSVRARQPLTLPHHVPGPQAEIFQAFTELFQVACAKPPPLGLCDYPSSRAVYAIDLMLKWDNRPDGEGAPLPHNPSCPPPTQSRSSSSPHTSARRGRGGASLLPCPVSTARVALCLELAGRPGSGEAHCEGACRAGTSRTRVV